MTKTITLSLRVAVVAALLVFTLSNSGQAHHAVLRFNLEEMTVTADRIFLGKCLAVDATSQEIAQGVMPVTHYTFQVERVIKGTLPQKVTFTQLGHPATRGIGKNGEIMMHGMDVGKETFIHGMSEYRVGDRVVLFLIPDYLGGKVTYPVGLYQGAFFVSSLPSGQELARNSINNLGLFTAACNGTTMKSGDERVIFPDRDEPLASVAGSADTARAMVRKRGGLALKDFISLVAEINAAHGGPKGALR